MAIAELTKRRPIRAAVFPGQGPQEQLPAMTRDLVEADPDSEQTFNEAAKFLGQNVLALCLGESDEDINISSNLQPAMAVSCVAAIDSLKRIGFAPDKVAGHSLGEYPALYTAGSITLESMCRLVKARAVYMEEANNSQPGGMTAVLNMSLRQLKKLAKEAGVEVGAENVLKKGRENLTVSGADAAMAKFHVLVEDFKNSDIVIGAGRKIIAMNLPIPYAAHARDMMIAGEKLAIFINEEKVPIYDTDERIDFIANSTAKKMDTAEQIAVHLPSQLTNPVKYHKSIKYMEKAGVTEIYEVGAGTILSGMNKHIVGKNVSVISFDPTLQHYSFI